MKKHERKRRRSVKRRTMNRTVPKVEVCRDVGAVPILTKALPVPKLGLTVRKRQKLMGPVVEKNCPFKFNPRCTKTQPFSFMKREEAKKREREKRKNQANDQELIIKGVFKPPKNVVRRTITTARLNELARPKRQPIENKIEMVKEFPGRKAGKITKFKPIKVPLKKQATTKPISPKFRTAARKRKRDLL